jgi:hypothetical protein
MHPMLAYLQEALPDGWGTANRRCYRTLSRFYWELLRSLFAMTRQELCRLLSFSQVWPHSAWTASAQVWTHQAPSQAVMI